MVDRILALFGYVLMFGYKGATGRVNGFYLKRRTEYMREFYPDLFWRQAPWWVLSPGERLARQLERLSRQTDSVTQSFRLLAAAMGECEDHRQSRMSGGS